ncbi:aminopeptidase [Paenibacillus thermotolerans]|uniref:aminopeptidase n=1 Tax=Paenibacillus thermotolerans TaxID=3027807 RepID=UPI0023681D5D|nr:MULTISPECIES: aminopeptidase [unclassified Paenibacillus]
MPVHEKYLDQYAELIVKVGANVQPGQPVLIGAGSEMFTASVEAADFIRRIVQQAYKAGASYVDVNWFDPEIGRLTMEHAKLEELTAYPKWKVDWFENTASKGAAYIQPFCPNMDLYAGIDAERVNAVKRAESLATIEFRRSNISTMKQNWVIAAIPTKAWASRMFPELPDERALEELWSLVLRIARADGDDPVGTWRLHLEQLRKRQDYMNKMRFRKLKYASKTCDLELELPEKHVWISGANTVNGQGLPFVPNIPTEEVFTSPLKGSVNGTVRSTLPLNYNGSLIEGIQMRFENGKIVEASATAGEEALLGLLDTDEGGRFLGEIALVPSDSPLARMGKVFYNTLFDENASCHLAFGNGFPFCLEGGGAMSREELAGHGVNFSATHVDFMIGSEDLDIDGVTAEGETVPIFRAGRWANEV